MKIDKLMEGRLVSISGYINHVATSEEGSIHDKISTLQTAKSLITLEINRLKNQMKENKTKKDDPKDRECGVCWGG